MTQIVQEGIEPLLIGEKLLQKIQYKPGMTTVFPAVEPLRADLAGDGMESADLQHQHRRCAELRRAGPASRCALDEREAVRGRVGVSRGPGGAVLPANKELTRTRGEDRHCTLRPCIEDDRFSVWPVAWCAVLFTDV
jgi:hypothetical protein